MEDELSEAVDANTAEAGRRVERVVLDMLLFEREIRDLMVYSCSESPDSSLSIEKVARR